MGGEKLKKLSIDNTSEYFHYKARKWSLRWRKQMSRKGVCFEMNTVTAEGKMSDVGVREEPAGVMSSNT